MELFARNTYLVSKALKNFLCASILTMAIQQLNVTIDGIIVSHFVDPDAFSAISLFMPLSLAVSSFGALFGIGATIVAARQIGELDKEKTDRTLSTAVVSVLVFGVLLGIVSILAKGPIVSLICHEERLAAPFTSYMLVMMGCSAVTMFGALTHQMVEIDGHPEYVTKAIVITAVTNVVLDVVFVAVFGWGIAGSAWATIASTVLSLAYLWRYLLSSRCAFNIKPLSCFSPGCLKVNMQQGASLVVSNLVLMVMFTLLNNIIQLKQGADGMFAFSICMNLLTLGMAFSSGIGAALMSIGGFLNGQRDYSGLKMLINRGIRLLEISIVAIVILIQLFPGLITGLFGANTAELQQYSNSVLRTFSWILPCVLLVLLLANIYQLLGKLTLVPVVVLMFPLVLIPSLLLWAKLAGDDNVWYAFPQTGIVIVLVALLLSQLVRRKEPDREWLTLVPNDQGSRKIDFSVKADEESMAGSLSEITGFLLSSGLEAKLTDDINHCVEEVMVNVVQHSGHVKDNHYFDVNINLLGDKVIASVKDDGKAFDPVKCSENMMGSGLKILHSLCHDIEYKYMYGQNMTFMKWTVEKN